MAGSGEEGKYKDSSREDLLKIIEKLEARKKYGLIWDEEKVKEQFEKDAKNALPILKEIKGKEIEISPDEPTNILIEGDNYHALSVLNFTHQRKVDVIYIDPPYNIGNNDFIYNDNYVEKEDSFRHSKWLAFMNKRLRLAKNLLKDAGVIFISIDNNEAIQLKLLLDSRVFEEDNLLGILTWINKTKPVNSGKAKYQIQQNVEYILCYSKVKKDDFSGFNLISQGERKYPFSDKLGAYRLVDIEDSDMGRKKRETMKFEILGIKPGDGKRWKIGQKEIGKLIGQKKIIIVEGKIKKKIYANEENGLIEKPFWSHLVAVDTAEDGKKELSEILGKDHGFDTVKPLNLIEEILSHFEKNITILDFFVGSGSTGHAVLKMNKEDSGKRQFILCTNNELNGLEKKLREKGLSEKEIQEHGICRRITHPRIEKVIKGYKNSKGEKIEGLGGNLKYFKTGFVKKTINKDDMKMKLTRECTEMLCLREGIFAEKKKNGDYAIFEQNGRIMAVYYSIGRKGLKELKKELDKMKGEKILYCFTLDPLGLDKKDFVGWKDTQLEPIPQKILDVYEEIYEY